MSARPVLRTLLAAVALALAGPVSAIAADAAPAANVVGNGTPGSCTENAFDTAVAIGADITFNCGGPHTIAFTHPATIGDIDLTIDGGNAITLTGSLTTTLFVGLTGSGLTLQHIVLEDGYNQNGDGGAITSFGDVFLNDVLIQSSTAGEFGGAIFIGGRLSIRHSRLIGNRAQAGGAIYALGGEAMTIADSTFQLNEALASPNGHGGAIYLGPHAQLTLLGGELGKNGAQGFGGALYLAPGAQALIAPSGATDAEVDVNSGYRGGGGIYNDGGALTLVNTRVEGNQTLTATIGVGFGGGIADLGMLVMDGGALASNSSRFGGGVFVGDGAVLTATAAVTHVSFFDNRAAVYGGGLYTNVNSTTVTLEDDLFAANQADSGGGLARTNAHLTISHSSFTTNTAQAGGGLFLQGLPSPGDGPYVELSDSTLSGNTNPAQNQHSGGLYNSAQLDARNVTLKNNHYGLFSANGGVSRLQSTVLDNAAFANCDSDGTPTSSGGHNFANDNSCGLTGFQDSQGIGLDPRLGPLTTDPLVFTLFHMPQPGSPLINHGGPACALTDQRYGLRPDACDIGAIEFGGLLPRVFIPLLRK